MRLTTKFIILSIIFTAFNTSAALESTVKLVGKVEFSPKAELPLKPKSICVTEDEFFLIPDSGARNIKIYKKEEKFLNLVSTIGRKGYRPGKFLKPTFCFYNKNERKLGVMDFGRKKIIFYKKKDGIKFEYEKEISCWRGGTGIQLIGNKLFISGYATDPNGNPHDFCSIDLTNGQITYLLPSYYKYGLKSFREYETQYRKKPDIPLIGINGWFDIHEDDAYFIWEGNLKIIKVNIVSGNIEPEPFGMQPPHYVKPYASKKMSEARSKRNSNLADSERAKMSYVTNIFVKRKYILVVYEGPVTQEKLPNSWLQFYSLDGEFLKEEPIEDNHGPRMWFNKDKSILYSFSNDKGKYYILKYKISSERSK
jgi:hypothetical protein